MHFCRYVATDRDRSVMAQRGLSGHPLHKLLYQEHNYVVHSSIVGGENFIGATLCGSAGVGYRLVACEG